MKKWPSAVMVLIALVVLRSASIITTTGRDTLQPAELVIRSSSTHETSSAHFTAASSWVLWVQPLPLPPSREPNPSGWRRRIVRRCKRGRRPRGRERQKAWHKKQEPSAGEEAPPGREKRVRRAEAVEDVTSVPPSTAGQASVVTTTYPEGYEVWVASETSATPAPTFSPVDVTTVLSCGATVVPSVGEAPNKAQEAVTVVDLIERVDTLPLILYWLQKMHVQPIIDTVWKTHSNWQGVSYGQLAVLFLTCVLHTRLHRLSGMEEWVMDHHTVLTQVTGWEIGEKDATDDRLGTLLGALGEDEVNSNDFQRRLGRHLIYAYALPTDVARYDTTTFSVHHTLSDDDTQSDDAAVLVKRGHSKDHRPKGCSVLDQQSELASRIAVKQALLGQTAIQPRLFQAGAALHGEN